MVGHGIECAILACDFCQTSPEHYVPTFETLARDRVHGYSLED
jgi:hypothetical protein